MPEFVEVEAYARTARPVIGGTITGIDVRDERLLRRAEEGYDAEVAHVHGVVGGATIRDVRRIGKLLLLDLSGDRTMALTFGLRGWLQLDGEIARADGTRRTREVREDHVRLALEIDDEHELLLEDLLRLATLEIDVDEGRLGVDVLELDKSTFRDVLAGSRATIKGLLMDQRRIAGIGNLIADEILYQGKADPRRTASEIVGDDLDDLWTGLRRTRRRVLERNGSHHGVLIQSGSRERGESCPRCDVPMERVKVGGRTSYFCPRHQR
ncbi:DNA-formamidopyrimidine glycosylase family protein [Ilumatobacter sp.]|uniref:DNA-formamidopyrimidine glycosylase family protein n=1 Tax=Ilumatobacter sp. TaxID=1967498 RepID=UPI003B519705